MHVSLAIATLGRNEELTRLLESLCKQSYSDFEVLICDQNPEGFLTSTLAPFAQRLTIKHIQSPPCGVSAARNALFPHIKGDIVAFPDDDCWYAPSTLEKVTDFFIENQEVGSILGVWAETEDSLQKNIAPHQLTAHELFEQGGTLVQFFRRNIVASVGNFDERLGPGTGLSYGCGEDTDYMLRAKHFTPVWRVPTVHIFHPLPNVTNLDKKKVYSYAAGRMFLLRKHNLPLWFKLANVLFPLYKALREGPSHFSYRWHMFMGRLWGLFFKLSP